MVSRVREALQLPGSPIPATIGVMLHEEQGRFITNTAEAIDRYMVIRLGRYANELGMKQEIDWARKQDLLSEVAFSMVEAEQETIAEADFIAQINAVQLRQGDQPRGARVLEELVSSGVLSREAGRLSFFRSSFRDFFAAHHIQQRGDLDEFGTRQALNTKWGGAIVFAAGLRRSNSRLLNALAAAVSTHKARSVDGHPDNAYFYGAYLAGRTLANSESSDHGPKMAALRTTLGGVRDSIPDLESLTTEQYGGIGHVLALVAAEHSLFVTVGVPWLQNQLLGILDEAELTDEERYMAASVYAGLGYSDCYQVLERAINQTTSTRVLVALQVLLWQHRVRRVDGAEGIALKKLERLVEKRLARRKDEVKALLEVKSVALRIEYERMRRIENAGRRKGGG